MKKLLYLVAGLLTVLLTQILAPSVAYASIWIIQPNTSITNGYQYTIMHSPFPSPGDIFTFNTYFGSSTAGLDEFNRLAGLNVQSPDDLVFYDHTNPGVELSKTEKFVNVLSNVNIIDIHLKALNPFIVTASSGPNGSISPSGSVSVNQGKSQTFTFTPNTGYRISSVLVKGINNPTAITAGSYTFNDVEENSSISVIFEKIPYTIAASSDPNGFISPSGSVIMPYGSTQTFLFTPNTGYRILQVLVDGANNPAAVLAGNYTFSNISAPHTIAVSFERIPYAIMATSSVGGSISPNGYMTTLFGDNQKYTFTSNAGYIVDSLLVDKVNEPDSIAGGSYTFINIVKNHMIKVIFIGVPTLELMSKNVSYNGQSQGLDSVKIKLNNIEIGKNNWVSYKYFLNGIDQNGQPQNSGHYKVVGYFAGNDTLKSCQSDSANLVIAIPDAPVITVQPQKARCCAGSNYTFNTTATGYLLSYQWYFNGQVIPGATSSKLQLTDLNPGNAGNYMVKVSNPGGSINSEEAILEVNSPALISSDLKDISICEGSDYTFRPGFSGNLLTYQWYKGNNIIEGAMGDTLKITGASSEKDYDTYRVEVKGVCGNPVLSRNARLWVAEKISQPILLEIPNVAYPGQSVRLHVGYESGYSDVTNYTWSLGEPNAGTYSSDQPTVFVKFNKTTDSQRISLRMEHVCGPYEVYKNIRVANPTGIDELESGKLKLFPSPFQSEVHIEGAKGCVLRIVNVSGATIYTKKIETADETILTGNLPEGVYMFRFEKDGKVKTLKGMKN